jgi:hypothetical protein
VSIVLLRRLIETGFCGKSLSQYDPSSGLADIHHALDSVIVKEDLQKLQDPSFQSYLAGQHKIRFAEMPYFVKCLQNIYEKRGLFQGGYHCAAEGKFPWSSENKIVFSLITKDGVILEPVYLYETPQYYVPIYALFARFLSNPESDAKIRSVSLLGDFCKTYEYPPGSTELAALVLKGIDPSALSPGARCLKCPVTGCAFANPFEQAVLEWMQAKQRLEDLEEKVKGHLTYHGPTKVGAHLVYLKKHTRRTFIEKHWPKFFEAIVHHAPKDYTKYLNPSPAEVFKAAEAGTLPLDILDYFRQSQFFEIDTSLTL